MPIAGRVETPLHRDSRRWAKSAGGFRARVDRSRTSIIDEVGQKLYRTNDPLRYERMFDTVGRMHFEVDVIVQHPLDAQAEQFLSSVQRSANRVLRFRGDHRQIIVTVEAHAFDRDGAVRAAVQEVAHIYPLVEFHATGEPRSIST